MCEATWLCQILSSHIEFVLIFLFSIFFSQFHTFRMVLHHMKGGDSEILKLYHCQHFQRYFGLSFVFLLQKKLITKTCKLVNADLVMVCYYLKIGVKAYKLNVCSLKDFSQSLLFYIAQFLFIRQHDDTSAQFLEAFILVMSSNWNDACKFLPSIQYILAGKLELVGERQVGDLNMARFCFQFHLPHSISSDPSAEENGETAMEVDEVESSPETSQKSEKNGIGNRLDSFK